MHSRYILAIIESGIQPTTWRATWMFLFGDMKYSWADAAFEACLCMSTCYHLNKIQQVVFAGWAHHMSYNVDKWFRLLISETDLLRRGGASKHSYFISQVAPSLKSVKSIWLPYQFLIFSSLAAHIPFSSSLSFSWPPTSRINWCCLTSFEPFCAAGEFRTHFLGLLHSC